jgi:carboxymethylenebutenolidase
MTGGHGTEAVSRFYETWFIGRWPEDIEITPASRTVGEDRVVDELIIRFTHDCEMPAAPYIPMLYPKTVTKASNWFAN